MTSPAPSLAIAGASWSPAVSLLTTNSVPSGTGWVCAGAAVVMTAEERKGLSGEQIGQELRRRRVAAVEALKAESDGKAAKPS